MVVSVVALSFAAGCSLFSGMNPAPTGGPGAAPLPTGGGGSATWTVAPTTTVPPQGTVPLASPGAAPTSPATPGTGGLLVRPGIYRAAKGQEVAVGVLLHKDIEGGIWTLVDAAAGAATPGSRVVVVVSNPNPYLSTLKRLEGRRVFLFGTAVTGATARMAGPEIKVVQVVGQTTPGTG